MAVVEEERERERRVSIEIMKREVTRGVRCMPEGEKREKGAESHLKGMRRGEGRDTVGRRREGEGV